MAAVVLGHRLLRQVVPVHAAAEQTDLGRQPVSRLAVAARVEDEGGGATGARVHVVVQTAVVADRPLTAAVAERRGRFSCRDNRAL